MILTFCILVVSSGMIVAAVILIVRENRKISAPNMADQVSPAGGATEPPTPPPELPRKLWPEGDELEAARWRYKKHPGETRPGHPMQEPLKKALEMFASEWGLEVIVEHHVWDFIDYDKHSIYVRMETMTKKERKYS